MHLMICPLGHIPQQGTEETPGLWDIPWVIHIVSNEHTILSCGFKPEARKTELRREDSSENSSAFYSCWLSTPSQAIPSLKPAEVTIPLSGLGAVPTDQKGHLPVLSLTGNATSPPAGRLQGVGI